MSKEDAHPFPSSLGPYTVEAPFKEGGMSQLYLSTQPNSGESVILKTLKEKYRDRPKATERFANEAKILELADHPNIVSLYHQDMDNDIPYLALEHVHGQSLHTIITHNPLSLRRTVEIILEIAYALCHLHTLGVIHRDLKPENLMLTHNGTIKLIDLGVAQMLSDALHSEDQDTEGHHQLVGTPIYMSPEQSHHPENVSYPSDIYSLGIIAYELVLGKLSHGQLHIALMPKGLQGIISRTLQPRIEDRYQDVVDLITDLSSYLNSDRLERERKSGDRLSELSEHLQESQLLLVPSHPPQWRNIELGVKSRRGLGICGLYYDFFELPEKRFAVVMAEPSARGVEGVIYTAVLRGMVRTLCRINTLPTSLISFLNDLTLRDAANQIFTLSYLVLCPREQRYQYIGCGRSPAWHLPYHAESATKLHTDNPALGVQTFNEFTEICGDWKVNDQIILHTQKLYEPHPSEHHLHRYDEESFGALIAATRELDPQKQAETLVRKVAPSSKLPLERHSLSVISINHRPLPDHRRRTHS